MAYHSGVSSSWRFGAAGSGTFSNCSGGFCCFDIAPIDSNFGGCPQGVHKTRVLNDRGGPLAQRLTPVTSAARVGCPGFSSHLGHVVLSLHVAAINRAGYLAVI